MLVVRRTAPDGSYFSDGDRASGVFGVLATGFSVLLGFIIFLGFTSYDESRSGAETEATIVTQQVETAQFLPTDTASELTGELVCYARSVVGPEWDALADGSLDDAINPWGAEMFLTMKASDPQTAAEQSAYDRWMEQTTERQQARVDQDPRRRGDHPTAAVAGPVHDLGGHLRLHALLRRQRRTSEDPGPPDGQCQPGDLLLLLLLVFFDHPHGDGVGRLHPTAMERTLRIMDAQFEVADVNLEVPCDDRGNPS